MPKKIFKTSARAHKKTPALVRGVLAAIAKGHTQGEACALADVSSRAWQNWVRDDSAKPERPLDWQDGDPEPEGGYREGLAELEAEARDHANAIRFDVHHRAAIGEIETKKTVTKIETRLRKVVHVDEHSGMLFESEEPYDHKDSTETLSNHIDLRAIEWELERSDRKNYSPPTKIEVTGEDGGAIALAIGFDAELAKLYGEEAAKAAMADVAGASE